MLMKMTMCPSNAYQDVKNCSYMNPIEVSNLEILKQIIKKDFVCAVYKNNYRGKENFLWSDCAPFDIDNDHSNDPNDWITPEKVKEFFINVPFFVQYSRHHMKEKKSLSPRPRFHIFFPIDKITDHLEYSSLKANVHRLFPYVDDGAIDSARFFYGTKETNVDFFDGTTTLNEFLNDYYDKSFEEYCKDNSTKGSSIITEGTRNTTIFKFIRSTMIRFGITEKTKLLVKEKASKCIPPLDRKELNEIWKNVSKFYKEKILKNPAYIPPEIYNESSDNGFIFDEIIPIDEVNLPVFPIETLPTVLKNYTLELSESTQTPIDMAALSVICITSLAMTPRYKISGKEDWTEPVNLYCLIVAEPSERKSAIINTVTKVITGYEANYNSKNEFIYEKNVEDFKVLKGKLIKLKKQLDKGEDVQEDIDNIQDQIIHFKHINKLILSVDDITPEALVDIIKSQKECLGIISSEGGIFDIMNGTYAKNVNIDVFLKSYSGDQIRVNRINRECDYLSNPKLTILITVQPKVIQDLMSNNTFIGRGLTARFLYTIPKSKVGTRTFYSNCINYETKKEWNEFIESILNEPIPQTLTTISLSTEASASLRKFYDEIEIRLTTDLKPIAGWAGKLCGNVLRIVAILTRARGIKYSNNMFEDTYTPSTNSDALWIVMKEDMENVITIGRYLIAHVQFALNGLGVEQTRKDAKHLIDVLKQKPKKETINDRDVMRLIRTYKTAESVEPVLITLADYGYLKEKEQEKYSGIGRPKSKVYLVNPAIYEEVK